MSKFIFDNKAGICSLFLGIVFISLGISRNEDIVVLMKAIAICLECIGIG